MKKTSGKITAMILFFSLSPFIMAAPDNGNEDEQRAAVSSESISIEDSLLLRDPFRKPPKFASPGSDDSIPELERYGLEQLKIVGIITGPKRPKALVATPNNKMFIVQENDRMGVHKGVLKKIREKSIIVRETLLNLLGQEESTDNEMVLNEGENQKKK